MQSLSLASRSSRHPTPSPSLTSGCNRRFPVMSASVRLQPCRFVTLCAPNPAGSSPTSRSSGDSDPSKLNFGDQQSEWSFHVRSPTAEPPRTVARLSLSDQAFFLLAFIACTVTESGALVLRGFKLFFFPELRSSAIANISLTHESQ